MKNRDEEMLAEFVKFIEQHDLMGNDPILIARQFINPTANIIALGKPEPLAKNKQGVNKCKCKGEQPIARFGINEFCRTCGNEV